MRDALVFRRVGFSVVLFSLLGLLALLPESPYLVWAWAAVGAATVVDEAVHARRQSRSGFPSVVRRFQTVARRTVVVHYDPALERLDAVVVALLCERHLAELERAFGFRLRYWRIRRPRVYLFRSAAEIPTAGAVRVGGYAVWEFGGIVLGLDSATAEGVRHEFTHLLAKRRTGLIRLPQLAEEGLAVWAERSRWGIAPHDLARRWLRAALATPDLVLPITWVYSNHPLIERHYVLAGSFTGYLIERHGWATFWRFYRGLPGPDEGAFRQRFRRHFGMTFEAARSEWLDKLRNGELTGRPGRETFESE